LTVPGGAPGVRPFAVLLPPAGVGTSPSLGPTCRFLSAPPDSRAYVANRTGRRYALSPTANRGRTRRPRALAAAPGLRPRGRSDFPQSCTTVRWARDCGVRPPWAFPLSGLRTPALGTASASLPLVGFADVPERDATGEVAPPRRCPRWATPGEVAVILSNGHGQHLWHAGPSATCADA
jgi:hypothetical protein